MEFVIIQDIHFVHINSEFTKEDIMRGLNTGDYTLDHKYNEVVSNNVAIASYDIMRQKLSKAK